MNPAAAYERPFSSKRTFFIETLGIQMDDIKPGHSILTLDIVDKHLNPCGVVHGGVTFSLVDTGMGMALLAMLKDDDLCVTSELKIHYLEPVSGGTLRCDSTVIKKGRRLGILESDVYNEKNDLVAKGLGTYSILHKPGFSCR